MGAAPMANALAALAADNMQNPFPHPLYETFHHDHPPIPERIRYVQEMSEETAESAEETPGDGTPSA
ncbi:STE24 endopeptidase [Haloarchaeobius iranensis]|uniref:STE24 endopeptidase n=2 Tax=Haloarchaeobius iranensis TaxID=996166 RepID=A0A1G9Z935_9EURY|nr:STE24 endopeptidase [Haloarchaeobius iranensis]